LQLKELMIYIMPLVIKSFSCGEISVSTLDGLLRIVIAHLRAGPS